MAKFVDRFCSRCPTREKSCFKKLQQTDLDFLNANKITTFYKKGQNIFYAGRIPTGIFCLYNGKIKISKIGYDGKEQIVRFVLPGQLLGIRALLTDRCYRAFASALEDSTVCFIDRESFFKITSKYPEISNCMLSALGQLLGEAEDKMTSMAQKPVRVRLAETLLFLNNIFRSESEVLETDTSSLINLPREDLANIVGTATETIIRLLSEFKAEGLISIDGRRIILKDFKGIQRIAQV
jgi:CRP/FNR family transcriptional regulator